MNVWQEPQAQPGTPGPMTENAVRPTPGTTRSRQRHLSLLILVVAVLIAAVVVVVLALQGRDKTAALPQPNGGPALVSQGQLERLSVSLGQPVYWAGPKSGYSYELTRTASGRIFVRYLPKGVQAGDPRASFLVVGTYSQVGSYFDLKRASKQKGAVSVPIADGGIVVFSSQKPTSVYVGYPDKNYQVEVYSPSGDTARSLVLAGKIKPVT